ncbi:unnamed protein product, partial [Adineta steineri]
HPAGLVFLLPLKTHIGNAVG